MRSLKARLLILATMLAMLIALAAPASADHWGDWEDAVEFCVWLVDPGDEWDEDEWEAFVACVDWYLAEHDQAQADDGSAGDGSGPYWDDAWLGLGY
jgi:hypothetical protein